MSFEFPFEYARIPRLGLLFYPIVRIELKTLVGWQSFEFLVDTGADMTTLPKTVLPSLGIHSSTLSTNRTLGVGGIEVKTWEFQLPVRIGNTEFSIRASTVDVRGDAMPFLLGRKDLFEERFSLTLDSKRKVTILTEN